MILERRPIRIHTAVFPSTIFALAGAQGCLFLPQESIENEDRAPLQVVSTNIVEGQQDVPLDVSIELRFNQPLDPRSLDEAGMSLGSGDLRWSANVRYDAVQRTMVFDPRASLRSDLWYTFGMDRFPLSIMGTEYLDDPIEIRFRTGSTTSPATAATAVSFERDIWPTLSGCYCHNEASPVMDFVVLHDDGSPRSFLEHSVGTPSREWNDWTVIDPGDHASSYIIYKLLGNDRLGLPTIIGDGMPPGAPLPLQDVEMVRDWIEQGAGY